MNRFVRAGIVIVLGMVSFCGLAQAARKHVGTVTSAQAAMADRAQDSAPVKSPGAAPLSETNSTKSSVGSPSSEREYLDGKVVNIDSKTGVIQIQFKDEKDSVEKDVSLKINTNEVDVTNPAHQSLELSDVAAGDMVDIFTNIGSDGIEKAYEIVDYNRVSEDE